MQKTQKLPSRNSQGFTLGTLLLVIVFVGLIALAYRFIARSQRENSEQAKKISNALNGEGEEEVSDTDADEGKSYTDQSQLWENPIRSVDVKIEPLTITLTATLPGSYQGTCMVDISQPDGTKKRRFVEQLKGAKTCSVYIPTSDLKDAKTWRYQFGYYSNDGRTYGKYPESTLSL